MKTTKYFSTLFLWALTLTAINAQNANTLVIPDVNTKLGEVWLPVVVNNTDEIVAMQFDLTLPEGVYVETFYPATSPFELTDRSEGMVASVTNIRSNLYRVLLYHPDNNSLSGNNGEVMRISLAVNSSAFEGETMPLAVDNAVLSKSTGENVLTSCQIGSLHILKSIDLLVGDLHVDADDPGPGDHINVSWKVKNNGVTDDIHGWSEYVYLVAEDGYEKQILSKSYDKTLNVDQEVGREEEIRLPEVIGINGRVRVKIVALSWSYEPEKFRENNMMVSDTVIDIQKKLKLTISPQRIDEGSNTDVTITLRRSGRNDMYQSFNLTATQDSRVDFPDYIYIGQGKSEASLALKIKGNDEADADSVIFLTVEGNGYPAVNGSFKIEDTLIPFLSLSTKTRDIHEGGTFTLQLKRNFSNQQPLEVEITCENREHFDFPSKVMMQPGEFEKNVTVSVVDNDEIEEDVSIAFRATTSKYESGECLVMFHDNDLPAFSFTISPNAVSESVGVVVPATGIIRCEKELNTSIEFRLSDNSHGDLSLPEKKINMQKGKKEVQFPVFIAKDNSCNDGNRIWQVNAEIYSSSCNCSLGSKANINATITVIDDDGPALSVSSKGTAVLEGSKGNVFTIRTNNTPSRDLPLKISSDRDDLLVYDHQLTLPNGTDSVTFLVDVKTNSESDDDAVATLKVETEGYAMGTCSVLITDQNLPDATIRLSADRAEVEAESALPLVLHVKNSGNAILRKGTQIAIQLWKDGHKLKEAMAEIDRSVVEGDSVMMEYNYAVPSLVGNFILKAKINPKENMRELFYSNNGSNEVNLTIISPFSLTARVDKKTYLPGENVVISGEAQGARGRNADMKVYLINNQGLLEQEIKGKTDNEGRYSILWQPLDKQVGHYTVGACFPSEKTTEEMDAFDIAGLKWNSNKTSLEFIVSQTDTVRIKLQNPMSIPQTGLTVSFKDQPANCEIAYSCPDHIAAGDTINMELYLNGKDATKGNYYESLPVVVVNTAEGAQTNISPLYYFIKPQKALLSTTNPSIKTTMTLDKTREYPIVIKNTGMAPSGTISVSCPAWMSPTSVASIEPDDSVTVVMKFTPDESMQLNKPKKGYFTLNTAKGNSLKINYDITPVTKESGTLTLDVVDEFTFFGTDGSADPNLSMDRTAASNDAPHVSDAKVRVMKPGTYEVVAEGTTDYNGLFTAELQGGFYLVSVEADGHKKESKTLEVPPGMDTKEEVMLWSDDFLESSWSVEETEVEDEYTAETTLKYDVRVPVPRIFITFPDERPQVGTVFPVTVSNLGYINARDVYLDVTADNDYGIEYLSDAYKDVLGPNQSFVTYVKLTEEGGKASKAKRADEQQDEDNSCLQLLGKTDAKVDCYKYIRGLVTKIAKKYGKIACVTRHINNDNTGGGSNKPPYGPGGDGGGGGGYGEDDPITSSTPDCVITVRGRNPLPTVDCLSEGKPEIEYHLVRPGGDSRVKEDIRKGVAADSTSMVEIMPNLQFPDNCDCEGGEYHIWTLSEPLGILEENGWFAKYTAPDKLPGDGLSHKIIVYHKWKWCEFEGENTIEIEIRRPPLLLLHGLNSDAGCWKDFKNVVVKNGLYDKDQVNNDGYKEKSNSHFTENQEQAADKIDQLINTYKKLYQLEAKKVDIVGHSMGGILARLHVQYVNNSNVHKIITVNTPHSGSQLGDIMMWHPKLWSLANAVGFNPLDAVCDLATESSEIDGYLNNPETLDRMNGISVHAIGTQFKMDWEDWISLGLAGGRLLEIFAVLGSQWQLPTLAVGTVVALQVRNATTDMDWKDLEWIKHSDLVVPLESQRGGLDDQNFTLVTGPHHLSTTHDKEVHKHIISLLNSSSNDGRFYKYGLHPKNINYTKMSVPRRKVGKKPSANKGDLQLEAWREGSVLHAQTKDGGDVGQLMVAVFDNQNAHVALGDTLMCEIPSTFCGDAIVRVMRFDDDGDAVTDSATVNIPQTRTLPVSIEYDGNTVFTIGYEKGLDLTCLWEDGSETTVMPDRMTSANGKVMWKDGAAHAVTEGEDMLTFTYKGMSCVVPVKVFAYEPPTDYDQVDGQPSSGGDGNDTDEEEKDDSNSVCSTITLKFDQSMVMTRQAFRGKLTLSNKLEGVQMRDIKMTLDVRDSNGKVATSREMQMEVESLAGLVGEKDLSAKWTLDGGKQGVATYLFIPTQYAAPTEPVTYSFGGTLSYTNPYTGKKMVRQFTPVELQVSPSPLLDLTYFMQRDVMGDDPLTEDVEPMEPAEFALLVSNVGYGDAKNVKLATRQPVIVDNQKGLAVEFEIVSSQLNGKEKQLSLGESVVTNFGTLKAHSQSYAQWWLQSSLLGHFTDYDVKVTHVTSHDNPDLSLVRNATIHELVHGFNHKTQDGTTLRGFLVNDISDSKHQPDHIYLSDATDEDVAMVDKMECTSSGDLEYKLTVSPSTMGWNYGSIADPTNGRSVLASIKRARDGKVLPADNVWQTSCTLRDNRDPIHENRLHFVGILNGGEESYILTFTALPDKTLEVERLSGVPEEGALETVPVRQVEVVFNKPIDPASFTVEDVCLACQGEMIDTDNITITRVNDQQFVLDISSATLADGYYVLVIQTSGIVDKEGFNGQKGKLVSWVQYADGKVNVTIKTEPEVGGTVTPASGKFGYGSIIHLEAAPAYGYMFSHWLMDDQVLSKEPSLDYLVSENTEIHAVFVPLSFPVDIFYDEMKGQVVNTPVGTYHYDYGTMLHLVPLPREGYQFLHWMVNGEQASDNDTCNVIVNGAMTIEALFDVVPDGIDLARQPGSIRFWPVPVDDKLFINGNFRKIHQVRVHDIQGKTCQICTDIDEDGNVSMIQLPPGMYILIVTTDNGIYHGKVTKR